MHNGPVTTATVLFCDLVDSTAQRTSLGDDAADQLAVTLDALLRGAISSWRGSIVKSTGDGLMAVFAAASDALSAATAIQQLSDHHNRTAPEVQHLVLRIGISAGDVHYVANDCHGTPVVEAARLESAAEPRTIYVSALVRLLAGSRGGHHFEPIGLLELKGLAQPVETFRVPWQPANEEVLPPTPVDAPPAPTTQLPLPSRLAVHPASGVIGYEAELRAMTDALKRVDAGDGREILLVSGEAGLGKSTIAAEVARRAHADGACVLFGHCEEDLARPYQMFTEALGPWVTQSSEPELRAHVAAYGSELVRLAPTLVTRIPDLPASRATDADTERFLLFAAVIGLLTSLCARQPVVLVLDDLQWADKSSLALLSHLAATELASNVLVIATYRDSELPHAEALRATLGVLYRHPGVRRVELGGLDDGGVVALLEAIAGYTLNREEIDLAHAVYRETDGNPFFVTQVLRHLVESGSIYQDATGRWVTAESFDSLSLPDSVREVIGGRVVRLGTDAERLLSLAAVIGRDFDLDLLARVTETSVDELLDILEAAAAVALVREPTDAPGRYNFAHALIQRTLYENLGPTRRARAHRRVGEALEDICQGHPGARVGELARHWFSAGQPKDLAKALDYSRQAADAALEALAPGDALRYYLQALDLQAQAEGPDQLLAIDLGIGLGTAQRQTGDPDYSDTLLDAARRAADLGDTKRLVAAALAGTRGFFSSLGAVDIERIEILELALERLQGDNADRALLLATLCNELTFGSGLERRVHLAGEADAMAHRCGDDATIVRVLNLVATSLSVPSLLDHQLAQSEEALRRASNTGDPVLIYWANLHRSWGALSSFDIAEADRCLETMAYLVDQLKQPTLTWMYMVRASARAMVAGDIELAEELATAALQIATDSGQPDAASVFGGQLMIVYFHRGALAELIPVIEQTALNNPGVPTFTAALALAYVEADRLEEARSLLERFAASGFDLPQDIGWLTGTICYAEAAIQCRATDCAGPLFERLRPWAGQLSNTGVASEGPVSHYVAGLAGVMGRHDEAEVYFAQAAAFNDRVGATAFAARTDLSWGSMLLERHAPGDVDKARNLLTKARIAAAAHGYANVERRAAQALQALD